MSFVDIEIYLWRFRRLVALLIVITIIQFFELLLLHYKYDIFTGGFLQPFSFQTFPSRLIFLILSVWYDAVFFGFSAVFWFYLADRFNRHGMVSYYNFTVFTLLLMGCWLAFKFEVLSYFNDTIDFQIIRNIGGGSLREALLYISNEVTLFFSVILVFFILTYAGSKIIAQFQYNRLKEMNAVKLAKLFPLFFIAVLLTPIITYWTSLSDLYRYGLKKKTSYSLVSKALDAISDFDRDGFGVFLVPRDINNFNARLYPGAIDKPGNEINENGLLSDAVFPIDSIDPLKTIPKRAGKHIVLIVLESARADLLEKKIGGKYVAPALRELAKQGTAVKSAYSHTGYTVTSITALFNRNLFGSLDHQLLDFLKQAGYQISIISGQDESFGDVANNTGMKSEDVYYFDARVAIDDRVYVSKNAGSLRLSEERVVEQFKRRIAEIDGSRPQFIYLNFQAAHFPYAHPNMVRRTVNSLLPRREIRSENRDEVADAYWNAIANADWAVGEVVDALKQKNIWDNTLVTILGDHGESLFENGFLGHGYQLDETQTGIPLIFNDPDIEVNQAIGQVDVAEMMIRSALDLENKWLNSDASVFQFVGKIQLPILIANVQNHGVRTLFDFRTEQVYFSEQNKWINFEVALGNDKYKERVENLIHQWEKLTWKNYQVRMGKGNM